MKFDIPIFHTKLMKKKNKNKKPILNKPQSIPLKSILIKIHL